MVFNKIFDMFYYLFLPAEKYARFVGVKIGQNCRIVSKSFGSEPYLISLGNHVHITKGVSFVTHDGGVWVFREEIKNFDVFGKINVGNNTYIGNNSVILPGVTIGNNCIIGANSVVTKSIPDGIVVAGNPAKYICKIIDYKTKIKKFNLESKSLTVKQKRNLLLNTPDEKFIIKAILNIGK